MPRRLNSNCSPDLFEGKAVPSKPAADPFSHAEPRARDAVLLPSDLKTSLAVLSETEFARLLTSVITEASRRGLRTPALPERVVQSALAEAPRRSKSKTGSSEGVTATKANLVRAAIKAGVKPSAIARQFGLSKAAISEVLKTEEK